MSMNHAILSLPSASYPALIKVFSTIDENTYCAQLEIALGDYVGFATKHYMETGQWPLKLQISRNQIPSLISAVNLSTHEQIEDLYDIESTVGRHICITLESNLKIKSFFPVSAYNVMSDDIRIPTDAAWRQGSPAQIHALMLARYSGLPVIYADFCMSRSLMVDWCADHQVILVPQKLHYGDFTAPGSQATVVLMKGLEALARSFGTTKKIAQQMEVAQKVSIDGKKLAYVVGTSPEDQVHTLDNLADWAGSVRVRGEDRKIVTVTGKMLQEQLEQHLNCWRNTEIIFVDRDEIGESIFESLGASAIL